MNWAQRWRRRGNAHWQTKADIPFSPHGCAASLVWGGPCTYRCQTPDSSQIIIDGAVLGHRHRLWLPVKLSPLWPAAALAHGCRATEARWKALCGCRCCQPRRLVRKQSASSPLGHGRRRTCALLPLPGMPCPRACLRGTPALEEIRVLFWPTCMQRDDLRRRTLRELILGICAHGALPRRTPTRDLHLHPDVPSPAATTHELVVCCLLHRGQHQRDPTSRLAASCKKRARQP